VVAGRYLLRACIVNFHTARSDVGARCRPWAYGLGALAWLIAGPSGRCRDSSDQRDLQATPGGSCVGR
jgi:hypothetical protein